MIIKGVIKTKGVTSPDSGSDKINGARQQKLGVQAGSGGLSPSEKKDQTEVALWLVGASPRLPVWSLSKERNSKVNGAQGFKKKCLPGRCWSK